MARLKVVTTDGFRAHIPAEDCWCRPTVEDDVVFHRHSCSWLPDEQERMTVYSDRLAQS